MKRRDLLKNAALLATVSAHPRELLSQSTRNHKVRCRKNNDRLDQGPSTSIRMKGGEQFISAALRKNRFATLASVWSVTSGKRTAHPSPRVRAAKRLRSMLKISLPCRLLTFSISAATGNTCSLKPGRLDLFPFWQLALDAAERHNLKVAFRVQLSNPEFQPDQLALPQFLIPRVPLVKIGPIPRKPDAQYLEPRYDHPEFQRAFNELNDLLAARFRWTPSN